MNIIREAGEAAIELVALTLFLATLSLLAGIYVGIIQ